MGVLLHTYFKRLGKAKFWSFITIPIVLFLSIFLIITPFLLSVSSARNDTDIVLKILVDTLGYTVPAVLSSILFGLPFFMIARNLSNTSIGNALNTGNITPTSCKAILTTLVMILSDLKSLSTYGYLKLFLNAVRKNSSFIMSTGLGFGAVC